MKKVIFVGGTSFSGSTLLDMILSNDPKGISLGEIHALAFPYRKHHIEERLLAMKDMRWNFILNHSIKDFYLNIFRMFPEYDLFIDSSKNPLWIKKNYEILSKRGIAVSNILIYKKPVEIAQSFIKRDRGKEWERSYVNYHKLYGSLIKNFKVVAYNDLVVADETLNRICEELNISYFKNKKDFWNKPQFTFFGNNRTRYHTLSKNSELEDFTKKNKDTFDAREYRKIYYNEVMDSELSKQVNNIVSKNSELKKIVSLLEERNLAKKNSKIGFPDSLKLSLPNIFVRKIKMHYASFKCRLFF